MTTDPNELAKTPGTPTGQELAAVAGEQSSTVSTPGTPSAEGQSTQGDSGLPSSSTSSDQQGAEGSPTPAPAGQSKDSTAVGDRVARMWEDFKHRRGIVED